MSGLKMKPLHVRPSLQIQSQILSQLHPLCLLLGPWLLPGMTEKTTSTAGVLFPGIIFSWKQHLSQFCTFLDTKFSPITPFCLSSSPLSWIHCQGSLRSFISPEPERVNIKFHLVPKEAFGCCHDSAPCCQSDYLWWRLGLQLYHHIICLAIGQSTVTFS